MASKYDDDYDAFPERSFLETPPSWSSDSSSADDDFDEKTLSPPFAGFSGPAAPIERVRKDPLSKYFSGNKKTAKGAKKTIKLTDIKRSTGLVGGAATPEGENGRWFGQMPASLLGLRWLKSWPVIVLIVFGILGTVGTTAVVSLFRIPNLPNCRAIFWPTASASLRLQCAESYAAQDDVENLLAAIALVDELPDDHPLRSEIIDDRIEAWANQVLDLAESSFEQGDLGIAISTARTIPQKTAAAQVVQARITLWQEIWMKGEDSFNAAVKQLKAKNFQEAFTLSVALLDVDNKFWSTQKYNELTELISRAREDSRILSDALALADKGTVKGFTDGLKQLREIEETSVFYAEAQENRKDLAEAMLERGEDLLADQNLSEARSFLNAIPRNVGFDQEIADFQIFVTAYQQAWSGNVGGLENAIAQMKTLAPDRPRYVKGQVLIAQWQDELKNIALLNQAKARAGRGSNAELVAAIAVARQVSRNAPQWEAATVEIDKWQTRIETVEDRPILERADRLAEQGTPDNLRAAIQEAKKVAAGRTLSQEASERIANWTERVQRIEDQPLLDQARTRANRGDLPGAIAIAQRIAAGRSLYVAAQDDIASWQTQVDGRQWLAEAINVASQGDTAALINAIEIVQRVPADSDSQVRAARRLNQWSWALLRQAESRAQRNLERAIALASQIPSQATAYQSAQVRISNWQDTLSGQDDESRRSTLLRSKPANNNDSSSEGSRLLTPDASENGLPDSLELVPSAGE